MCERNCSCHDKTLVDNKKEDTERKQDFENDVDKDGSQSELENKRYVSFGKEDKRESTTEGRSALIRPDSLEETQNKFTNVPQDLPTTPQKKNLNPNNIAVGDNVSFAGWVGVGLEDGAYITFTGEVLKIDQERGGSLVRKINGETAWLTTKKLKKSDSMK